MDFRLEVVVMPSSDIDRSKAFYADKVGFVVDVDVTPAENFRVVQLTPPGSPCSISLVSQTGMTPGAIQGLHLIVSDIEAARVELTGRGLEVGEIFHYGATGQEPGLDPNRQKYGSYMAFSDPDGNGWLVQEA